MAFHFYHVLRVFLSFVSFLYVNFDYDDLTLKYPSVTLLKKVIHISAYKSIN